MKQAIQVENLIKKYRKAEKNAVDDITFSVEEGELFTFLGPNGAGKTTTISILTTTLLKTSGSVTIAGFDLDRDQNQIRQNVGIIFQNPSLDLNLTAEENIRFHSILYGLYSFAPTFSLMPESYKKRVKELSDVLGLKDEIFNPVKSFSGGMKRKLEIIRSLMHHPKVLFLDEPTVGLDPLARKNLWEYLKEVREKEKTTIFLTTHYLDEAEGADHVCIINHGKVVAFGTPDEIKKDLIEDYIIVDSKDRKKLLAELSKLKYEVRDNGPFKIMLKKDSAQKVIQSIKTPLSVLETHSPSLEEAYVEIIEGQTKGEDQINA